MRGANGGAAGIFYNEVGGLLNVSSNSAAEGFGEDEGTNISIGGLVNRGVINVNSSGNNAYGVRVSAGWDYTGLSTFTFINSGELHVSGPSAYTETGVAVSLANITNSGLIDVSGGAAAAISQTFGLLTLTNSGTIQSTAVGLGLTSFRGAVIDNSGTISAPSAILSSESSSEIVHNSGEIKGLVDLGGGADVVVNTGEITRRP